MTQPTRLLLRPWPGSQLSVHTPTRYTGQYDVRHPMVCADTVLDTPVPAVLPMAAIRK